MKNDYGYFTDDGREFIITRRDLPFPWLNYLTNGDYLALTSFQGGGLSSYLEQRFNSLTRRYLDMPQSDMPGRFVYVRDRDSGESWSVTGHPTGDPEQFRSTIGLGYTRVETKTSGLKQEALFFVPKNPGEVEQGSQDPCEIWRISLTNEGKAPRRLRLFSYSEWVMGDVLQDMKDAPFFKLFRSARYEDGVIFGRNSRWGAPGREREPWPNQVFLTSTRQPVAWELSTLGFVGMGRTLANPAALEGGELSNQESFSGDNVCGCLAWDVDIAPGESASLDIILGLVPDGESRFERLPWKYQEAGVVDEALETTKDWWRRFVSSIEVDTPDSALNDMVNVWNKYQIHMTLAFGHGPSYFHGNQHATMRDSMQDSYGLIPLDPAWARRTILRAMSFQYSDGSPSYASNRMGMPEAKWDKVDLPVWLALTLHNYLSETGDWAILDEPVAFYDAGEASLFEHLRRGLERVSTERGAHGLPLMGGGDWNDALDGVGKAGRGESVWLAQFLVFAFNKAAEVADHHDEEALASQWRAGARELTNRVNDVAWDGQWYLRAFDDEGRAVGGRASGQKGGMIYLNTQTWAVMSGVASEERGKNCLAAALEHLLSDAGMALFAPPYQEFDPSVGVISQFPAGKKENAACFTHAGAFNLVALLQAGMGDEAYGAYRAMLPSIKPQPRYRMEPYTYSQYVAGPGSSDFGQGAFHWMTGSASWMFRAVLDWMIGVRPELDGLRFDPCLPSEWRSLKARRLWRGVELQVEVRNPEMVNKGVQSLIIDGAEFNPSGVVSREKFSDQVQVIVIMG